MSAYTNSKRYMISCLKTVKLTMQFGLNKLNLICGSHGMSVSLKAHLSKKKKKKKVKIPGNSPKNLLSIRTHIKKPNNK